MTFVTRVFVEVGGGPYPVVGRGQTQEEAELDCLQNLKRNLENLVELADGVLLPVYMVEKMPTELPVGFQLVIFERLSHSSGDPTGYRFFALKPGNYTIDEQEIAVTDKPTKIGTLDSNSDVTYPLPLGSMEYVDGVWVYSSCVDYDY